MSLACRMRALCGQAMEMVEMVSESIRSDLGTRDRYSVSESKVNLPNQTRIPEKNSVLASPLFPQIKIPEEQLYSYHFLGHPLAKQHKIRLIP